MRIAPVLRYPVGLLLAVGTFSAETWAAQQTWWSGIRFDIIGIAIFAFMAGLIVADGLNPFSPLRRWLRGRSRIAEVQANGVIYWAVNGERAFHFNVIGIGREALCTITFYCNGRFVGERQAELRRGLVLTYYLALSPADADSLPPDWMPLWGAELYQRVTLDVELKSGLRRQRERFWSRVTDPSENAHQHMIVVRDLSRDELPEPF